MQQTSSALVLGNPAEEFSALAAKVNAAKQMIREFTDFVDGFKKKYPGFLIGQEIAVPVLLPPAPDLSQKGKSGEKKRSGGRLSPEGKAKILEGMAKYWVTCYHPKCEGKKFPSSGKRIHDHFKKYGEKYKKPPK